MHKKSPPSGRERRQAAGLKKWRQTIARKRLAFGLQSENEATMSERGLCEIPSAHASHRDTPAALKLWMAFENFPYALPLPWVFVLPNDRPHCRAPRIKYSN